MSQPGLEWQIAIISAIHQETGTVKTFTLQLPHWSPHRAGQHYDVRLTAPDGYQAQRSYSIASPPEQQGQIDLTVERIEDGEVSPYLHDVLVVGDQVEVRGPIGGYFTWQASQAGPLLLIAGGSGVVPLMAMLRHRAAVHSGVPARLLYSVRTPADVIYREDLESLCRQDPNGLEVIYTFTRQQPPGWTGYSRRIDAEMLREVAASLDSAPLTYICGPTLLVESAANALVGLGYPPSTIKTERFGPTGA